MKLWKNKEGTHLQEPINGEYSLCGDAFEGDRDQEELKEVEGDKVTCRRCLKIIREIKGYLIFRGELKKGK
jgi:hypothetical protein